MNNAVDIRDYPELIDKINAILNNHNVVELKNEAKYYEGLKVSDSIACVEISRRLRANIEK